MKVAGVIAATSGALLVVALLLPWWGPPPVFLDPPADAPAEITFPAEAFGSSGVEFEEDAYRFFGIKDLVWLFTGLAGFCFGLLLLTAKRLRPTGAILVGVLALISAALIVMAIVSPPDYFEISTAELGGGPVADGIEAPFGREPGAYVALVASLGLVLAALVSVLRTDR